MFAEHSNISHLSIASYRFDSARRNESTTYSSSENTPPTRPSRSNPGSSSEISSPFTSLSPETPFLIPAARRERSLVISSLKKNLKTPLFVVFLQKHHVYDSTIL